MEQELPSAAWKCYGYGKTVEDAAAHLQWTIRGKFKLDRLPWIEVHKSKRHHVHRYYIHTKNELVAIRHEKRDIKVNGENHSYYTAEIDQMDTLSLADVKKKNKFSMYNRK